MQRAIEDVCVIFVPWPRTYSLTVSQFQGMSTYSWIYKFCSQKVRICS